MEALLLEHTDRLYDNALSMLHEAVKNRIHPFHTFSLATIGLNNVPKSRTVVLRRFDPFHRHIVFQSDIRSPKIKEMARIPSVSLLFYSQPDHLQIRLTGKTEIHYKDNVAAARWEQTQTMGKLTYISDYAPSSLFPNEEAQIHVATQISTSDDKRGFENFCVIVCNFYEMDITALCPDGNLRVHISCDKHGHIKSERLIP